MKIISWNIWGCNHPSKIKTLTRKVKQEKPDVIFSQETKCSSEVMEKLGHKIWKGSKVMAIDAARMEGGLAILWQPNSIDLSKWRYNNFSLTAKFKSLDSGTKGTLVNVYGPSAYPHKQVFYELFEVDKRVCRGGNLDHWRIF